MAKDDVLDRDRVKSVLQRETVGACDPHSAFARETHDPGIKRDCHVGLVRLQISACGCTSKARSPLP